MQQIEILAPAKDLETGIAAINCGADAVYIGGAKFGAREAAANALEDIAQLAAYAHKYWARVYITLNTLLYDEELAQAQRLAHAYYELGADALIIQDAGLLELDLPPLPLFASTQMHTHTPERAAFLEKVGFQRVILARELSLEQIRAIRASTTTLELETFIHGALCVSYSGQCYMSYAAGGRSGNRGQCAQPCRKPYRLLDRDKLPVADALAHPYLLSLRDFNATAEIPALLEAGVTSFKIEGRLKEKTYVMNVVGHYRQQIDRILQGKDLRAASSGTVIFDFAPDPLKTFNRGYTNYFLRGRQAPVGSPDTPKSLGEPLGKVARMGRGSFMLDRPNAVQRGDGLCFFAPPRDPKKPASELTGATVNDVQGGWIFIDKPGGLVTGVEVYRNADRAFQSVLEKSQTERKINLRFRLAATQRGLALFARDEDGCEAMFTLDLDLQPADRPEQAMQNIEKQLGKLGGTIFNCQSIRIDLPEACFVPLSTLNALRRGAVEALEAQRAADFPRLTKMREPNHAPYPAQKLTYTGNVLNKKARAFYRRHGVTEIEPAAESGLDMRGRKVMTTRHCIKHQLGYCLKYSPGAKDRPRLAEPLALVDEQGHTYPLRFDCAACQMEVYFETIADGSNREKI